MRKLYLHVDVIDDMDFEGTTVTFLGVLVQELDA